MAVLTNQIDYSDLLQAMLFRVVIELCQPISRTICSGFPKKSVSCLAEDNGSGNVRKVQ
jgi:hypothetical protein